MDHERQQFLKTLKLGKDTAADDNSLDIVPRALARRRHGTDLPFHGYDLWNGYEVSFLDSDGKPQVYHLQLVYDAHSDGIVESKSLKLFFNSYNNRAFPSRAAFAEEVGAHLRNALACPVALTFFERNQRPPQRDLTGLLLDDLALTQRAGGYDPDLLQTVQADGAFSLHTHLLRSHCPVTNQPDWGAVQISGRGARHPEPQSLLNYIVAMRSHQDFHEACCETLFMDLWHLLNPDELNVSCHYTRRGGWDINPIRSSRPTDTRERGLVWRQ